MQPSLSKQTQDFNNFLVDVIDQLDMKVKEFRGKVDPKGRKKGSKTDNNRRSAEQIEEHKRMIQKLQRVSQKEPNYAVENAGVIREIKENVDKYLKNPGTLALSKSLHDNYKSLQLDSFKEPEDAAFANSKGDQNESEPETYNSVIRDFIVKSDNQVFDFKPCASDSSLRDNRNFLDMFKQSFLNRPTESDYHASNSKKTKWNPDTHSILPRYKMVDESVVNSMDLQTLFLMFYHQHVVSQSHRTSTRGTWLPTNSGSESGGSTKALALGSRG